MKQTHQLMRKLNQHFPLHFISYSGDGRIRLKARKQKAIHITYNIVAQAKRTKHLIREIETELAIRNVCEP